MAEEQEKAAAKSEDKPDDFDMKEYESPGNEEEYPGNEVVDTNAGEDASDGGVASVDDEEVRKTEE